MCIRDSFRGEALVHLAMALPGDDLDLGLGRHVLGEVLVRDCLLYTSDAADERSSVDLGGRRIIKKKTD